MVQAAVSSTFKTFRPLDSRDRRKEKSYNVLVPMFIRGFQYLHKYIINDRQNKSQVYILFR